MYENITIGESLIVTVTSVLVVFLILILISFLIDKLKAIGSNDNSKRGIETVKIETKQSDLDIKKDTNELNEELIAAIAAAIAYATDSKVEDIQIRTIKRIPSDISDWKRAGQLEQIFNKI
jgi:sodium pump decarboxylase gamma subunit